MMTTAPASEVRSKGVRILVVEDEVHLAEGLLFNLQAEGYEVALAGDGETALSMLLPEGSFPDGSLHQGSPAAGEFDAVLLDAMLPGRSGFEVAAALRAAGVYIPVLMLTARSRPEDVLLGLEAGADDYLPKPFDLSILLARLRVLLRRVVWQKGSERTAREEADEVGEAGGIPEQPPTFSFAGRVIDFSELVLTAKGAAVRLTLMEADFLRYLSQNPFRIIPRKELLEQVWRVREDTDTRAIDNFVVRLRRYIEDEPASPVYLKTVRGVGYRFLPHGE